MMSDTVARKSDHCSGDPSPHVASKGGSQRVTMVTLVCLWILLLCLASAWVVQYTFNKIKDNLAAQRDQLTSDLQHCKMNLTEVNNLTCIQGQRDQLTSELQPCKMKLTEVNNLSIIQANPCSSGLEFYNGSCYHFSVDILTWEQSQYACIREGGHLVIIDSQQEQNFIRIKVGNIDFVEFWIGLTDMKTAGTWVWMDNTTLNDNITYWDMHIGNGELSKYPEPNSRPPEKACAKMGSRCAGQISCWFDDGCNTPSQRICESRAIL
ncbi:hypothetical protein DPEC_G00099120 [Dallia pectoralis]|uniref:Uncharacterized protein n=1 Tax=Dallia pectoralis TaxID=75939 RepID=A0ACC2GX62_DALPE|nr:hypothetical protein DPEC_G00099120 [Dallia pectoralis]